MYTRDEVAGRRERRKLARKVLQIFGFSHVCAWSGPTCLRHAVAEIMVLRHLPAFRDSCISSSL